LNNTLDFSRWSRFLNDNYFWTTTRFIVLFICNAHLAGVDVMITIFCDFRQFSTKKLAFFSKTNVMINLFKIYLFFSQKRQFFRKNFRPKYFLNHNIGPWTIKFSRQKIRKRSFAETKTGDNPLRLQWQLHFQPGKLEQKRRKFIFYKVLIIKKQPKTCERQSAGTKSF
jgi:hypothetical protein